MFLVTDISNLYAPRVLGFIEAVEDIADILPENLFFLEEDDDNPKHWDAITESGRLLTIEPNGEGVRQTALDAQIDAEALAHEAATNCY
jgi:hypothetical protein